MGLFSGAAKQKEEPLPPLTVQQAQAILKAGDLQVHEDRTYRLKARTDETEVSDRSLILTLPDDRPNGNAYQDFLAGIGATPKQVSELEGMWLGTRGECTVPRICHSYGSSAEGTMEVSMPVAPLEKVAGMTWEQANPHFAAASRPAGRGIER